MFFINKIFQSFKYMKIVLFVSLIILPMFNKVCYAIETIQNKSFINQSAFTISNEKSTNFFNNKISQKTSINWMLSPSMILQTGFEINSNLDTINAKTWFTNITTYGDFYSISVYYDSNDILQFNSLAYKDNWAINYQQNHTIKKLDLSYNFSESNFLEGNHGHSLNISLETNKKDYSGKIAWHYHSRESSKNGHNLFNAEVSYFGYQLKTGQNKELTAIFLYHRLMSKKTEQHRKYAQLATQLSLKLQQQANKLFVT